MLENLLCLLYASDLPYFFLTALCPDLNNPANGAVSQSGNSEGDTGNYTCNAGYELAGAPVLNCQADGTWDNPPPTCTRQFLHSEELLCLKTCCVCCMHLTFPISFSQLCALI